MSDYLIVIVNRALARFFTLEPVDFPEVESGPRLVKYAELGNSEMRTAQDLYTDSKTGRGTTPQGGAVHGYDDHRHQHLDEVRRRFAGLVLERTFRLAKTKKVRTIIMAASARMRRFLFDDLETMTRHDFRVIKVSKNMINFTPQKIHELLAGDGLIPQQKKRH